MDPPAGFRTTPDQSDEEINPGMRRRVYIGSARAGEVTGFLSADEAYNPSGSEGLALDADGDLYTWVRSA